MGREGERAACEKLVSEVIESSSEAERSRVFWDGDGVGRGGARMTDGESTIYALDGDTPVAGRPSSFDHSCLGIASTFSKAGMRASSDIVLSGGNGDGK